MNKKINASKGKLWLLACCTLFVYSVVVLLLCIYFSGFSEWYCSSVCAYLRYAVSAIFGIFSFCTSEILLVLLILFVLFDFVLVIARRVKLKAFLLRILSIVSVLIFLFINVFGVCYTREPIEKHFSFSNENIKKDQLLRACLVVKGELENSLEMIEFYDNGASSSSHSWRSLNDKIDAGFDNLREHYSFVSNIKAPAKKLFSSKILTYTHISGIFVPFTAEACVNVNYPEYVTAYSTAHEKAHQRGIASEDEANFVAFLACLYSGDEYLKYSALLSMYEYYLDEIYKHNSSYYRELLRSTDKKILGEMYAYSVFFDEYRNSGASVVAEKVNDTYIKTMGDSTGTESYGRVVELCTKFLNENR